MKLSDIENLEIQLLLEAVYCRYGYDFRNYARASIRRRIIQFMQLVGAGSISEMIPMLIHDEVFFGQMVKEFSITVTEMFRDPAMFLALRNKVIPVLKSYPYIKVWHAGCATGEEAYSLAILMEEENLGKRTTVFATDFNDSALEKAKEGIFPLENVKKYSQNYQNTGGKYSFSNYYQANYGAMVVKSTLKETLTFANHNLVTDQVFTEAHLILCRNVLIYFNKELQEKVMQLFDDSLVHGGFLCLGAKESLLYSKHHDRFREIDAKNKIYQKIS
ncbi:protein-glutamate O-methyltransferase CheR [Desulforhopalus sp. IMCC35007]|uniref:CheR family methyltransferase n=1 Tax=Desulforhopalus sp. IMCC35007 TaxID=2569543 RepID=UPI0010AEAE24|nr:protein-glutamate O-methyltransferase CheR [Desulforhopalus sp. IMCC35007]TKB10410.1 protein-glutamate O-methyltransferase CheR [Desulforhopalus sp. IMCC35007]